MKRMFTPLATTLLLAAAPVMAQMPAALLDNATVTGTPEQWKAATPALLAALECRKKLNLADRALRPLLLKKDSPNWTLVPPQNFAAFGLPVQSIRIYIDPDGELGASYTAILAAPLNMANKAVKVAASKKTNVGGLSAEQGERPSLTKTVCTVSGE